MKFNWKVNLISQLIGLGTGIGYNYQVAADNAAKTGTAMPGITDVAIPVLIAGGIQLLAGMKAHYTNPDGKPAVEPFYPKEK